MTEVGLPPSPQIFRFQYVHFLKSSQRNKTIVTPQSFHAKTSFRDWPFLHDCFQLCNSGQLLIPVIVALHSFAPDEFSTILLVKLIKFRGVLSNQESVGDWLLPESWKKTILTWGDCKFCRPIKIRKHWRFYHTKTGCQTISFPCQDIFTS